eukprot:1313810-Pyramimonas_sp.AAC.1
MLQSRPDRPYKFDHPLFEIYGVTGCTLAIDSMHTVDLGVTSHILGTCCYEIVFEQRRPRQTVKQA